VIAEGVRIREVQFNPENHIERLSAQSEGNLMWQKNCPVCRHPLEKRLPTDTVACSCGKYVWKG